MIEYTGEYIDKKLSCYDFSPHEEFIHSVINKTIFKTPNLLDFNFPHGAILVGVPGSGKTSLAEKIALEMGGSVFYIFPEVHGYNDIFEFQYSGKANQVVLIDCVGNSLLRALKLVRSLRKSKSVFIFEVTVSDFDADLHYIEKINYNTFPVYKMPGITQEQIKSVMHTMMPDSVCTKEYCDPIVNCGLSIGSFVNIHQHTLIDSFYKEGTKKHEQN